MTPIRDPGVPMFEGTRSVSRRRFGVEIETNYQEYRELMRIVASAVLADSYDAHDRARQWIVKGEHCGLEVCSPPIVGTEGRAAVRTVCRAMRAGGATVRRDCGLHVHHDARDLTLDEIKQLYRNWYELESIINRLVSPSRRSSQWCSPINMRAVERIESISTLNRLSVSGALETVGRYRSLNLWSYPSHGTVEIRLHQGTLNARKINSWVMFGQAFIDVARADVRLTRDEVGESAALLDALREYGLPSRTAEFLKERAIQLSAV